MKHQTWVQFWNKKVCEQNITCKTLHVFSQSWSEKRSVDRGRVKTSWLQKVTLKEKIGGVFATSLCD
jgi:hypothetical protein